MTSTHEGADVTDVPASGTSSLTVRDNRTGQEYDVPIVDGAIKAADLGAIRADARASVRCRPG